MYTKLLREQRAGLTARSRALADKIAAENRDFTAEERAEFDGLEKAYSGLTERIRVAERVDAMESESSARSEAAERDRKLGRHDVGPRGLGASDEHRALALAAWIKNPRGGYLSEKEEEACRAVGIRPDAKGISFSLLGTEAQRKVQQAFRRKHRDKAADSARSEFTAALSNESGPKGGYLVPPGDLMSEIEVNMLAYGGLLQVAETMTTENGEEIRWPTADDTSNRGRRIAVNAQANTTPDPTFAQVLWGAHEYTSDAILVPYRLLEDGYFDLPKVLGAMLGERLGRVLNTECTTGTGNAMPWGFITRCATFAAASSTAIFADDLIKLQHAIDPAYRSAGDVGWMMHDQVTLLLRLLKNGVGEYLWQDGLRTNAPDVLLGKPVNVNQDMASSIASGAKSIVFGRLSSYKVRRVNELRFYRLDQLYRISGDQDAFVAFMRADGNLLTAGTPQVKVLAH